MAHFRLDWVRDATGELDMVRVDVRVAFNSESELRTAGTLMLHASEVNALDRLLTIGSRFENPAHTFEIVAADVAPLRTHNGRR
jgi:hypothetical protein